MSSYGIEHRTRIEEIAEGFKVFSGTKRRFQTKFRNENVWIVDDYAHHPTEIQTTIKAAKQTNPKRLIVAFQPHRYSRTQLLQKEFGSCFVGADVFMQQVKTLSKEFQVKLL